MPTAESERRSGSDTDAQRRTCKGAAGEEERGLRPGVTFSGRAELAPSPARRARSMDGGGAHHTLVRRRPGCWWREPRYATRIHRFTPRFAPYGLAGRSSLKPPPVPPPPLSPPTPPPSAPPPPPPAPPPAPPAPFLPDRIGKRPRRERPPAVPLVPPDEERMCSRLPCTLSRAPPTDTPDLSPSRGQLELLGQRYGPRNTCSVDTMLTLAQACRTAAHAPSRSSTHPPSHSSTHPTHPTHPSARACAVCVHQGGEARIQATEAGRRARHRAAAERSLMAGVAQGGAPP